MTVAPSRGVCELGGALLDQKLPLGPRVVLLGEDPLQLPENLVFLPGHALPAFLQPVDGIALKPRDDSLEAAEVLEHPELLGDVDPRLEDPRPFVRLEAGVHQDRGDDAKRHGVELVDGRENRGGVVASSSIAT